VPTTTIASAAATAVHFVLKVPPSSPSVTGRE
jgi:hypothetical protein